MAMNAILCYYQKIMKEILKGDKVKKNGNRGIPPYADKYEKIHNAFDIKKIKIGTPVKTAGRIMLMREMGKLTFAHLQDFTGRIQIVLKSDIMDKPDYNDFLIIVGIGDFIGVEGEVFKTKKGEISILVKKYKFLSRAIRSLPEKWHSLKDKELCYRQRYLDLLMNRETVDRFNFKNDFIWELRKFYRENGFQEIETPVLCDTASGALAKPFKTHHNTLDIDLYLRIAPELYLKEAIIGGYEKIFEVARVFRNEGVASSHLQEFTMVEHYCAYWDYKENMKFTEKMLTTIIQKLKNGLKIEIIDRNGKKNEIDFTPPWDILSFKGLLVKDCGIDIDKFLDVESLRNEIAKKNIIIEGMEKLGRGNLIDALYKEVSRPKIIKPTFLIQHPIDVSPLARKNDENPSVVDRFQFVVNGWEIINAYSELIDPVEQSERFRQQMKIKQLGDEEAMSKDDKYIRAMEYGMPPISGWGMGIERMVALLTQQSNLKDVVLFPIMKPESTQ